MAIGNDYFSGVSGNLSPYQGGSTETYPDPLSPGFDEDFFECPSSPGATSRATSRATTSPPLFLQTPTSLASESPFSGRLSRFSPDAGSSSSTPTKLLSSRVSKKLVLDKSFFNSEDSSQDRKTEETLYDKSVIQLAFREEEFDRNPWLVDVEKAVIASRIKPSPEGKNGAFFAFNESSEPIAVVKPEEHELGAAKSRISTHSVLQAKNGINPGEGARTEFLAWKIAQRFEGKVNVPSTLYTEITSSCFSNLSPSKHVLRRCAVQQFIPFTKPFSECTQSELAAFSKQQSQMLPFFDILMFNTDRNPGNLLVKEVGEGEDSQQLVLIDHGCCLPRHAESAGVFCWDKLPQIFEEVDPSIVKIVEDLPFDGFCGTEAFADLAVERKDTHVLAVHLLKEGLRRGLNFYEISNFCTQLEELDTSIARRIIEKWVKTDRSYEKLSEEVAHQVTAYKTFLDGQQGPLKNKESYDAAIAKLKTTLEIFHE